MGKFHAVYIGDGDVLYTNEQDDKSGSEESKKRELRHQQGN